MDAIYPHEKEDNGRLSYLWLIIGVLVVALIALGFLYCAHSRSQASLGSEQPLHSHRELA